MSALDVLIPTCDRPAALAVTLTALASQTTRDFRVVVADQSTGAGAAASGEVQAVLRVLAAHGNDVELHRRRRRRGMAEQRHFLLERAQSPYVLFLDDDVVCEPDLLARMLAAITQARCGFVGCALVGLSYADEVRLHEQHVEFWEGPVVPEEVRPDTPEWDRHRLHNAANVWHLQRRLGVTAERPRLYKVAWVGGCVLYDTEKLRRCGGFSFWEELPSEHAGEDVLAQLRVMARFGGCGLLPSGAYHQELPTTLAERDVDAPLVLAATAGPDGPAGTATGGDPGHLR